MQRITARNVKIRYNTESNGKDLVWRLLIDGKEHLVNHLDINCPCQTTTDWLEDKQVYKHHITVRDCILYVREEDHHITIEKNSTARR